CDCDALKRSRFQNVGTVECAVCSKLLNSDQYRVTVITKNCALYCAGGEVNLRRGAQGRTALRIAHLRLLLNQSCSVTPSKSIFQQHRPIWDIGRQIWKLPTVPARLIVNFLQQPRCTTAGTQLELRTHLCSKSCVV